MLLNLHKKKWADGLTVEKFDKHMADNEAVVMVSYAFDILNLSIQSAVS